MRAQCALVLGLTAIIGDADALAQQQQDRTATLLARSAAHVRQFVDRFSNVVAEERYLQEMTTPRRKRQLLSDFLLVAYPGATQWVAYRDVREVDGNPVPDRSEQLTRLFLEAPENAWRRLDEIARAGTRYHLVDTGTLGNPLIALGFLQEFYQRRFRFTPGPIERSLGPDVRLVRFEERHRPTVLRTDGNVDLPARGWVWIEEQTGAVVKTELEIGRGRFPIEVVTSFAPDADLGIHVPAEMREWYPDRAGHVSGIATYGRFRRFEVRTEAAVQQE